MVIGDRLMLGVLRKIIVIRDLLPNESKLEIYQQDKLYFGLS